MNENSLIFFENMANDKELTSNSVKLAKNSDFSDIDVSFILKYANENSNILDLGSGTGLIVNKIYKNIKSITAVEPFKQFTNYITESSNIKIINENILDFSSSTKFDLITLFGVMHYFDEAEAIKVYSKYINFLVPNGKIIIKNQFGIKEDVIINNFSMELQKKYYAQYRYIEKETEILKKIGYKNIQIADIYPVEFNRWKNTHFFAIVAQT